MKRFFTGLLSGLFMLASSVLACSPARAGSKAPAARDRVWFSAAEESLMAPLQQEPLGIALDVRQCLANRSSRCPTP